MNSTEPSFTRTPQGVSGSAFGCDIVRGSTALDQLPAMPLLAASCQPPSKMFEAFPCLLRGLLYITSPQDCDPHQVICTLPEAFARMACQDRRSGSIADAAFMRWTRLVCSSASAAPSNSN